jgi:outer membrane scaffolding protein for murein synthesis (MipA/OmpV family)
MAASTAAATAKDLWSAEAFDITAGAGVAMRPTYLGSDRYRASPIPLVNVRWNDMVSLGEGGLNVYWHDGPLKIGAGLTFDPGRDEKNHDGFSFESGDDRLKGLGKIDAAIGYQLFASYQLWKFDLDAAVVKYDGKQNKGLVVRAGAGLPIHLTSRLVITPTVGASWANDRYMQTFFGIDAAQALRSGYAAFDAESGFLGVTAGLKAQYAIDRHWFVLGAVSNTFLAGDAKKSPITISDSATTVATAIGYRF